MSDETTAPAEGEPVVTPTEPTTPETAVPTAQ